jgi:light-regulated signal transduction histidine kinase (bacteriophytochrome)
LKKDQHKLFITPDSKESYENYIQNYMDMVSGILQFDRVMLYQFQEDWNGEVVAERVASDDFGSYLNLRFPASDIPKIARDLYLLNPSRIIADTQAKNIDIIAFNSEVPDLTYSDTRSVSPVHIEYLKNMGVIASFSIPIVISDNLWGLLACHNFSQKILDPLIKDTAIEKTKLFALGVKNFLAKEKLNYLDVIQYKINDILDSILNLPNLEEQILNKEEEILRLISSDGFAIVVHNRVIAVGKLPEQNSFRLIDSTFLEMSDNTFITDCISLEMLEDKDYLGPTGVLGIKSVVQGSTILRCYWFRNEFIEELHWAGNPNKPVIEDAGAMRLSPRRSFESFIEIKRGYSKKFNPLEVSTALNFSNKIFNYLRKVT